MEADKPPRGSLVDQLRQVVSLLRQGDVRSAGELARLSIAAIPRHARGTRLTAYAVLAQTAGFVLENREEVLAEASASLQEGAKRPEERLAAAWLLTAYGGERDPKECERMLAAAQPFHGSREKKKSRIMAITITAANALDTEAVIEALRGLLAENDEQALGIAFRRAAHRFAHEDQERGLRLLQEAIEWASDAGLRDQLKAVRDDLRQRQVQAARNAIERAYRELCEGEKTGAPLPQNILDESLEQYRLLCRVSVDLRQKAQAAFSVGLVAWKCGDVKTARGLHAVALDRMEFLVSEGHINPADPAMRHMYDWSAYWKKTRE